MLKNSLRRVARPFFRKVKRILSPPLHRPEKGFAIKIMGTEYGGWPVLDDSLGPDSVVYCFGVGDDVSFDLSIIDRFGCAVEAFDPTPRCAAWVRSQALPEAFHFHNVGLSDSAEILRFYAPLEDGLMSYTVASHNKATQFVELPVEPLDMLMTRLGHSNIDFLKMDIEGAEYSVIGDMMNKAIFPTQLCIEFHHGMYTYSDDDTRRAVAKLKAAGYVIHYISQGGREYGLNRSKT